MFERFLTPVILIALLVGTLFALRTMQALSVTRGPDHGALVSGEEPITELFTRAGCVVCHAIPGIVGAEGRVGPRLDLATTGPLRLADPSYRGSAHTVHEYAVESVINPRIFVAPGYPAQTMPTWYGAKLSALAVEKIASYLEQQRGAEGP